MRGKRAEDDRRRDQADRGRRGGIRAVEPGAGSVRALDRYPGGGLSFMSTQVLMPALSPTMTEGKLSRWLKKVGDSVAAGDVIAEIETDKATMEVEAVDEGTLGRLLVDEGAENVAVNAPIAILLEEGEDASAMDTAPATGSEAKPEAAMPKSALEGSG